MKKIAASAINVLKEALSSVYWYKSDLRSFLLATISDVNLLSHINWEDYKINICGNLINYMQLHEETYQKALLRLITEVVKIQDYSHLLKLDGGEKKARQAKNAIKALKDLSNTFLHQQEFVKRLNR